MTPALKAPFWLETRPDGCLMSVVEDTDILIISDLTVGQKRTPWERTFLNAVSMLVSQSVGSS